MNIADSFGRVSEQQIDELEQELKVSFPKDYRHFLIENNGGRPSLKYFRTQNGTYQSDIQFFYDCTDGIYGLKHNFAVLKSIIPKGNIAIANDSLGNSILMNTITNQIYFFDHELEEAALISLNFSEFINTLFNEEVEEGELDFAFETQNVSFFQKIIESGKDINGIVNGFGQPIIIAASLWNKIDLVEFFLKEGAVDKEMALLAACTRGHRNIVELLLDNDVNINAKDSSHNNETPLLKASHNGHLDIVKLLIGRGADLQMTNTHGQSVLDKAHLSGNAELKAFLETL